MINKALMNVILKDTRAFYDREIKDVELVNQGYYGLIFLVSFDDAFSCVAKVYKGFGHAKNEYEHLGLLLGKGLFHSPKPYYLSLKEKNDYKDILYMEYIHEAEPVELAALEQCNKDEMAKRIVDNIFCYQQNFKVEQGNWGCVYNDFVHDLYNRLLLRDDNELKEVANKYLAFTKESVFNTNEVLLHGDYNTLNLLVDKNGELHMIDPLGFTYGDKFIDIAQLLKKTCLEDIIIKILKKKDILDDKGLTLVAIYQFWDEIYHYLRTNRIDSELIKRIKF